MYQTVGNTLHVYLSGIYLAYKGAKELTMKVCSGCSSTCLQANLIVFFPSCTTDTRACITPISVASLSSLPYLHLKKMINITLTILVRFCNKKTKENTKNFNTFIYMDGVDGGTSTYTLTCIKASAF